ncbi:MAG: hypothetical protein C0399_02660 [Syntrophus sp. (in: bacteria)]|nr:hypothetical protein [Syntrophus sp. (in: bacteria)]
MKTVAVFVVLALLSVCPTFAASKGEIAPKSTYKQIGATLLSPSEAGWYLAQSTAYGIAFGRQYGSKNETAIANTVIFKVDGFEEDKAFLDYIVSEREKQDDKTRFKILDTKNEHVSFKGSSCLKYRALSEDHKSQGINSADFQYLKTFGYICRHPSNRVIAFQMEISHRGKDKAFPEALLSAGEEFFNNIQFNDQGLK